MTTYYNDCIVFLIAKAYQTAHGIFKRKLEAYGLTPVQNLILEVLWETEAITIGEISRLVAVDYATLSGMLDRMVVGGWVRKERNPDDGRSYQVFLTAKAKDMKGALLSAQEETNQQMTAGLSEAERLLLFRMLKELRKADKPVAEMLTDN